MALEQQTDKAVENKKDSTLSGGDTYKELAPSLHQGRNLTSEKYHQDSTTKLLGNGTLPSVTILWDQSDKPSDSRPNTTLQDSAAERGEANKAEWQKGKTTEFTPKWDQINQGNRNDCFFVAELQSLAKANPQAIKDMIKLKDGTTDTYLVRFPGAKAPNEIIEVKTSEFTQNGAFQAPTGDVDPIAKDKQNGLDTTWPRVLEVAAGKHYYATELKKNNVEAGTDFISHVEGWSGKTSGTEFKSASKEALELLTGKSSKVLQLSQDIEVDKKIDKIQEFSDAPLYKKPGIFIDLYSIPNRKSEDLEKTVKDIFDKKGTLVLGRDSHAYSVVDIREETVNINGGKAGNSTTKVQMAYIRNPWGATDRNNPTELIKSKGDGPLKLEDYRGDSNSKDRIIKIPVRDLPRYFHSLTTER